MKQQLRYGVMAATAIAAAGLAGAQQPMPGSSPDRPQNPPTQKSPTATPPGHVKHSQHVQFKKVSKVLGCDVMAGSQNVGEVQNVAIDASHGHAAFIIIDPAGELNIDGDRMFAVPWNACDFVQDKCTLKIDHARLKQAPTIEGNNWTQLRNQQFAAQVSQYYGVQPYWSSSPGSKPGNADLDRPRPDRPGQPGDRPGSGDIDRPGSGTTTTTTQASGQFTILMADEVLGLNVENTQDENLGEIEDLIVESKHGRIGYAVLSFGGFAGMGENLTAIPWQALNVRSQEGKQILVLNLDKARLENAPKFDADRVETLSDQQVVVQIHTFYGADPDWVYGFTAPSQPGQQHTPPQAPRPGQPGQPGQHGMSGGAGDGSAWQMNDEYVQLYKNARSTQTTRCRITGVQSFSPGSGKSQGSMIVCQTDDGQTMNVHLGPAWYIQNQPHQFRTGEQVTCVGARANFNGEQIFLAREIRGDRGTMVLCDDEGLPMWLAWRTEGTSGSFPTPSTPGRQPTGTGTGDRGSEDMPNRPPTPPPPKKP